MRLPVFGAALVFAVLTISSARAQCECIAPDEVHGTMGASVIFTGTVKRITTDADGRRTIEFEAHERFWGPVESKMEVQDMLAGTCHWPFEIGESYLVYGYAHAVDASRTGAFTSRCDVNLPVSQARERIRELTAYVVHSRQNPMEYHFSGR